MLRNYHGYGLSLACLAAALMCAGCSHTRKGEFTRIATPLPPAFLTGPTAVFLTNTAGFSAQVESQSGTLMTQEAATRGVLLGAGPKLLFAPVKDKAEEKRTRAGNFLFIWDVATGRGYVISEALQAYAPVSSDLHVTNVIEHASPTATGNTGLATMELNNGTTNIFQVLRSPPPEGFPLRINSLSNAIPFTVTFSKTRFESVTADLFVPPEDFTKYESPEAMVDELAARQRNLRRKQPGELDPYEQLLHQNPR
jgi:hypothetical protein